MSIEIVPLDAVSEPQREEAAAVLMRALAHVPSAWHTMAEASDEVARFVGDRGRVALAAIDGEHVVGWIGSIRHSPSAWELHPLVVAAEFQGQGHGTRLVEALESKARSAGVCTVWLGTDDDFGGTNLFGTDLYPDVLENLARLAPRGAHPYTFYLRQGYAVVGVLPDANGIGKHDILMAKRIASPA